MLTPHDAITTIAQPLNIKSNRWLCAEVGDTGTLYLVLPAGSLTAGGYYQFQLTAAYASGTGAASMTPGYSVIAVQMNAPPSSGTVSVSVRGGAPIGVVLRDSYDFTATGWVDDVNDMPLLYRRVPRCFSLLSSSFLLSSLFSLLSLLYVCLWVS